MKKRVLITRRIPQRAIDLLQEQFDLIINPENRPMTQGELLTAVPGVHGILSLLTDTIDAPVMDAAGPQLRVIANYAVGFNNIDVAAATERKICITNTPDVLTDATADLAWALLFACARRVVEGDKLLRRGQFHGWDPLMLIGKDITGATLGIIGAGRIGCNFGRKARAFGMNILYVSNQPNPVFEAETGARFVSMETLLEESDFVSVHVPLTPGTTHLLGENEFRKMKKDAVLINTARGPVVDEKALVKALQNREIGGAGLDVYEAEPQVEPELLTMEQVVLLPHIASATIETRTRMGMMAARSIVEILRGGIPENVVNWDVVNR